MNVATTSKHIEVLKCKHINGIYKYLCKLSPDLWALLVYGEDDETLIYDNVHFKYNDALYEYNHYDKGDESEQ